MLRDSCVSFAIGVSQVVSARQTRCVESSIGICGTGKLWAGQGDWRCHDTGEKKPAKSADVGGAQPESAGAQGDQTMEYVHGRRATHGLRQHGRHSLQVVNGRGGLPECAPWNTESR